ncbi:MAG: undecaprenyldiphospho-muramoylpentapeptide beta-N-acetylglucosaminyltransferase [Bacteroidota bacterium]
MATRPPRILLSGGGTGGHLFPALAIAEEIQKLEPATEFLFVGTQGKIEARVVPERGYPFRSIWISGFHRRLTIDNLLFPVKVIVSLVQSLLLLRKFRPDVVVGTGGYVCGPVLFMATWLGIPTVVHESNSYPGITTRLLASRVRKVFTAFESTKNRLPSAVNVELVGTPTRNVLGSVSQKEGRIFFGLEEHQPALLIVGGSLGAASINSAVLSSLDLLTGSGIQLIWQTGQSDHERVQLELGSRRVGWVGPFIDRMEFAFGAADAVACRAGATTLAELTRIGKPAILVPYPHAAADHQRHNARAMAAAGAGIMIEDHEVAQKFGRSVIDLLNDTPRLKAMSSASRALGRPDAGPVIAHKVLEFLR